MKNDYIIRFKKYLTLAKYSNVTIQRYSKILEDFLKYCPEPKLATTETLINFALTKKSNAYRKQTQGVFKHFFRAIEPKPNILSLLPRIKKDKSIPQILTINEVDRVLNNTNNIKHKALLSVLYYSGIRNSELLNLKIENINGDDFEIHIQLGKGSKDRIIPVPEETINLLRVYFKTYKPKVYLFNGQIKGSKYTSQSLQKVVKRAVRRARILKTITPHSFRHSRATHLISNGVDVKTLKEFLGHNSIKTTEAYLHISKASMKLTINKADATIKSAA